MREIDQILADELIAELEEFLKHAKNTETNNNSKPLSFKNDIFANEQPSLSIGRFNDEKRFSEYGSNQKITPNFQENKCDTNDKKQPFLRKFFTRRTPKSDLVERGILKEDSMIFGNTIENIYELSKGVPQFLRKCFRLIECPKNVSTVGIYRTSGNLATIQKLRLSIEHGNLDEIEKYVSDVDVLTGLAKLFFRELRQPLISPQLTDEIQFISGDPKNKHSIKNVIESIPQAKKAVLLALIHHLLRIEKEKDQNKMELYNLAVCWAPSLMFLTLGKSQDPVTESNMFVNVLHFLLSYFKENPNELRHFLSKENDFGLYMLDKDCEVVRHLISLIGKDVDYSSCKDNDKASKIVKKIYEEKLTEINLSKYSSKDLTLALRKYLIEKNLRPLIPNIYNSNMEVSHIVHAVNTSEKKDIIFSILDHLKQVLDQKKSRLSNVLNFWGSIFFPTPYEDYLEFLLVTKDNSDKINKRMERANRVKSTYDNLNFSYEGVTNV